MTKEFTIRPILDLSWPCFVHFAHDCKIFYRFKTYFKQIFAILCPILDVYLHFIILWSMFVLFSNYCNISLTSARFLRNMMLPYAVCKVITNTFSLFLAIFCQFCTIMTCLVNFRHTVPNFLNVFVRVGHILSPIALSSIPCFVKFHNNLIN